MLWTPEDIFLPITPDLHLPLHPLSAGYPAVYFFLLISFMYFLIDALLLPSALLICFLIFFSSVLKLFMSFMFLLLMVHSTVGNETCGKIILNQRLLAQGEKLISVFISYFSFRNCSQSNKAMYSIHKVCTEGEKRSTFVQKGVMLDQVC